MAAVARDVVSMVTCLIDLGAGSDWPADREIPVPNSDVTVIAGERALLLAARRGNVEIINVLLERGRINPNSMDHTGLTPLMAASTCPGNDVAVVPFAARGGCKPGRVGTGWIHRNAPSDPARGSPEVGEHAVR